MRFTEVKEVPMRSNRRNTLLVKELEEFVNMGVKNVKVTFTPGEYKNANSCQATLHKAIKREHLPIRVMIRGGDIYLVRTDM